MFGRRRPIQMKGRDRFVINLGDDERSVIRFTCEELLGSLDGDDPMLRRVFPVGHATDTALDDEYQSLVHDDLVSTRREILTRVAGSAFATEIDRSTLEDWMVGINTVRLVLGTRLDIGEDEPFVIDDDDPEMPARVLYGYLGGLLELVVDALSRSAQ